MALDIYGQLGGALEGYLGGKALDEQIGALGQAGQQASQSVRGAGQQAAGSLQFKPITVTSSLGGINVGADGSLATNLSQQGQQLQNTLLGQAQSMAGQAPVTQESLYAQLQAAQAPELQRQRDSMEAKLRAQGRLGLMSSAYGGSPEQLAFEKAAQEAQAANFFQAAQLAPQLQGQQLQNITGAIGAGYAPQTQLQSLFNPAATFGQLAQTSQTAQADALLKSQLQAAGIDTTTATNMAELAAKQAEAESKAYGGLFAAAAPSLVALGSGLFNKLLGNTGLNTGAVQESAASGNTNPITSTLGLDETANALGISL